MAEYPIVRPLLTIPRDWERRTAFSAAAGALSFRSVRQAMLGFAGWLVHEAGVKPGDRVALCLPKNLELIQALYGVLAAGGAYVGLQFRGPPARLGSIIASVEPRLLLTTPEMARQLAAESGLPRMPPILHIDEAPDGRGLDTLLRRVTPLAETVPVAPDDLAAIVFTSGSTNEPKGVMRSHRNLVDNTASHVRGENLGPQDMRPGNTPLHYISPNLFYPALSGCRIHVLTDQEVMFPEAVTRILEREGATTWSSAATALRQLIERGDLANRDLSRLRLVKSYGEPLTVELLRSVMAAFPQAQICSTYGSTEAPNIARFDAPRPLPADMRSVPLGAIEPDYEVKLCDEDGVEVPDGRIGEICAIGPTVALGYWKDPVLTAARRLAGRPDSYRTGDLAYFDADRTLIFVGRKDHMVKLRGHRFDLGEVEAALRQHPAVRDAAAVVVQRADGESEILAVVEAASASDLEGQIKQICAERLPRFAWPAHVQSMPDLPRLLSGKVDRLRLPAVLDRPDPVS